MNEDQKQIVLGTLLGNGYICKSKKNCYLCMRHSERHLPWLQSKAFELQSLGSKTAWYHYETTVTWRSACDPVFTELRSFCYPNGKKQVRMEWLDQLRDIGIAIWFGDSGCLTGRQQRNACLRTQSYGLEGNEIIERYFNEVGIPCNKNKSRNSYVIVFTVPGTQALLKMIAPCLPSNRYFRFQAAAN